MLDLGLTKMALIGVVALVVLGPERLPGVARTAGALFGRAQRYINDVKSEVAREMELDELKKMRTQFETAASNVETTIHDNLKRHESELNDAWNQGTSVSSSIAGGGESSGADDGGSGEQWPAATSTPAKRKNWRVKQSAVPNWYKRTTARRTRVQSGAARVARHTPATLRRPTKFF
ncbi:MULTISPECIES: Sec-independent protein translocase protein TatB [Caballeronia]|jgi:sec-independent protein translocase protein TatB|uniref:Sec-independent protein translocase protein TatB n=1 Tax=Caballeronia grimmiae TaxID=1071679 RepID=A0A069P1J9_9BURK|nr:MULTISPECIES: Sec-independent protein translocase protein TatB [Caballeronia]KDR31201.1 preprotein translocase [Caballeronia grimmiae]MDR5732929.1 Sec-independent protein translocase protein TatB [Caballeronia sp. LZ025]GGD95808.1 sec-independent protein translocase protein TatB [Caballeronia grimmiae]